LKISSNVMTIISILVMIEQAVGGGTVLLTNAIPADWIPLVKSWCLILAFIGTAVLSAGHAFSGAGSGPLASPPTVQDAQKIMDIAKKAATILLFLATALLMTGAGHAAENRLPMPRPAEAPRPEAPKSVPCIDILNQIPAGCTPNGNPLTNILTELESLLDTSDAISLSSQIPGIQDPVGGACWKSFDGLSQVMKAHPVPLTLKVATDLEAARLAAIALNQVCVNPNCTQMWADVSNVVNAFSLAPMSVSLQALCSKVPAIGTLAVPAVTPVTPTPTQLNEPK
jgi:hypothetical protein